MKDIFDGGVDFCIIRDDDPFGGSRRQLAGEAFDAQPNGPVVVECVLDDTWQTTTEKPGRRASPNVV
jgi:hypothetical protein